MIGPIVLSTLLAGGLTQNVAQGEKMHVGAIAATGTGLSIAGRGGETFRRRSPMYLNVEVPLRFDSLPWLEVSPGLSVELEGRVGVGIIPRFRAYLPVRKPRVYGLVGGVFYVHPYTLHGIQAGLGLNIDLHRSFALFGELSAAGFFAGSDLMEGSGLGKLDGVAGIRITF